MNKLFIALAGLAILIIAISCNKASTSNFTCTGPNAAYDSVALLAYAKSNGITTTADTSFLYYQIIDTGAPGPTPIGRNKITVTYVGKLLTGDQFDSTTSPVIFELDSLIKGWQYGLPKIRPGGRIKLLVPSALAFGCNGTANIPPNAPLYFDITLVSLGF